jgi:hypothetical protein
MQGKLHSASRLDIAVLPLARQASILYADFLLNRTKVVKVGFLDPLVECGRFVLPLDKVMRYIVDCLVV